MFWMINGSELTSTNFKKEKIMCCTGSASSLFAINTRPTGLFRAVISTIAELTRAPPTETQTSNFKARNITELTSIIKSDKSTNG